MRRHPGRGRPTGVGERRLQRRERLLVGEHRVLDEGRFGAQLVGRAEPVAPARIDIAYMPRSTHSLKNTGSSELVAHATMSAPLHASAGVSKVRTCLPRSVPISREEGSRGAGAAASSARRPSPAAARSSSTAPRSRSICSISSTRGRRRGNRGVATAPHGSPGASPARTAQRWNERIAASRCATDVRACPSASRAR